ncbi:hypothetical protein D3C84_657680 [compost metagenome]
MDLVGLDGETLRQVHGVERNQIAFAGCDDQARTAPLTRRNQREGVAVLLDLYGQGGDPLLTEQTQGTDATWQIGLIVEGCGERGNGERFVVKNGDIGHGYSPEMKNPAQGGVRKQG